MVSLPVSPKFCIDPELSDILVLPTASVALEFSLLLIEAGEN